jgi:CP family cyanate transporter-like MFS transporter
VIDATGVGATASGGPEPSATLDRLDPDQVAAAPVGALATAAALTSRRLTALLVVGVVLVAMNLRAAVTSLGALLAEVSTALGLSGTLGGVVTMLPTLSFAGFGIATPWLARRYSPARILVVAVAVLAAGLVLRAATNSVPVFLVCTATALSGIAVANVLLPGLVKQQFPHRVGLMTGVYTMSLVFGASAGAAAAVPIADLAGSWRVGLGAWAVLAAVAAVPWLPAALRGRAGRLPGLAAGHAGSLRLRPSRTGLGWAMAVFFGTQAVNGYAIMGWLPQLFRDSGFTPAYAGLLLAGVTGVGVPVALLVPTVAGHLPDLRKLVLTLSAATGVAYVGLMVAPDGPAVLWVLLLAVGQAAFPFGLTMIGLRSRTAEGTVALSAFTQSAGYLVAGLGPFLVGVLYDLTGGWVAPLSLLIVVVAVQTVAGLIIAPHRHIEDA